MRLCSHTSFRSGAAAEESLKAGKVDFAEKTRSFDSVFSLTLKNYAQDDVVI